MKEHEMQVKLNYTPVFNSGIWTGFIINFEIHLLEG